MTAPTLFPQLSFHEILKRLNDGAAVTVVTPNRRLTQALKTNFNRYQTDRQKPVWCSADILPFSSFLERIYLDAHYSSQSIDLPLLLTTTQAHALWKAIIRSSEAGRGLLNVGKTTRLAYEAWQLVHAWQLMPAIQNGLLNEDCSVFKTWMVSYAAVLEKKHQIDPACLADYIVAWHTQMSLSKPDSLFCYGFEILTPQQTAFLHMLQAMGCEINCVDPPYPFSKSSDNIKRVSCNDVQAEIRRAAEWARYRLEMNPEVSIAVVVPALQDNRNVVQRIFREVMQPDVRNALPQAQPASKDLPFNISLGQPLTAYPLVDVALSVLALCRQGLPFDQASNVICSPFLAGGESEMNQRALLVMRMRQYAPSFVTLEQCVSLVHLVIDKSSTNKKNEVIQCPILIDLLSALLTFCQDNILRKGRPEEYARLFSQLLEIAGFPGERTLDSTEYQTLKKWHVAIAEFAALDTVITIMHYDDAVEMLSEMAANTLFQPQTPDVPIQILGVLEAAGLTFDHLWVMGLTEEQWPLQPSLNPFLPYDIQKKSGMPLGSINAALNYSYQLKNNWLACAKEVILSHPKFGGNTDVQALLPSSMIREIPERSLDMPHYRQHSEIIAETACFERIVDDQVSPVIQQEFTGGVAVIKDFASCPFRAWARHRMHIEDRDVLHAGLNAKERGILVHRALCLIWQQLKTKHVLDTIAQSDFEGVVCGAVNQSISEMQRWRPWVFSRRFAEIERQRMNRLMLEWLSEEKKRGDFSVVATEEKATIKIGELVLRIRLDRMDELSDGQLLIIDYKTRSYSVSSMLGTHPDEPQLPLYLVMAESIASDVAGAAFASVKKGQMGFSAIVNADNILPGVKAFDEEKECAQFSTWDELTDQWKQDLTLLADDFMRGDARVLPKNHVLTCQYCELQPFCRIHERPKDTVKDQETGND